MKAGCRVDKEYRQIVWDAQLEDDCRQLVRLAVREDLERVYDWTTVSLVSENARGQAVILARSPGVIAGLPAGALILEEYDRRLEWAPLVDDGDLVAAGQHVAELRGSARSLLAVERPLLNALGHLSGIATLTRHYVEAVAGTNARVFDTRKTLPGWRRLAKYAVRAGGGWNHRQGLFDGVLIKDNHLALGAGEQGHQRYTPADAVRRARDFLAGLLPDDPRAELIVEIEVDTLEQLHEVLPVSPDIVLLDNMSPAMLRRAVAYRDENYPAIELEASGTIRLDTIGDVARSGVDRISVGELTHSARWFDLSMDWAATA
jgi:nicotinate-nucleotide pyrophosphorylase (carboxylating)